MSIINNSGTASATNAVDAVNLKRNYSRFEFNKQDPKRATYLNILDFSIELDFILNLYISRFKWKLSDFKVSNYYVEQNLFFHGLLACYKHKTLGWLILPATVNDYNVYGEPTRLTLSGYNFSITVDYSVDADDIVIIRDNPSFHVPNRMYRRYASLISDTARTCEVYANAMKKPVYFKGDFAKKKSLETLFNNANNNEFAIYVDESLVRSKDGDEKQIELWQTDHNVNDLRGLYMHKKSLYDEMLAKMGIESSYVHKAAQVTEDEINKNDLMTQIILRQSYECRKEAIEKIKEISGLNIECESVIDISAIELPTIGESSESTE